MGPAVFKTVEAAKAAWRVRFPSASATDPSPTMGSGLALAGIKLCLHPPGSAVIDTAGRFVVVLPCAGDVLLETGTSLENDVL